LRSSDDEWFHVRRRTEGYIFPWDQDPVTGQSAYRIEKADCAEKEIEALAKKNEIILKETQKTVTEVAELQKENADRRTVKQTQPLLPYQSVWIDTVDDDGKYTWREHYEWTKEYQRKLEEKGITLTVLEAEQKDNETQIHKLEMMSKIYRPQTPMPQVDWNKPKFSPFPQFPKNK